MKSVSLCLRLVTAVIAVASVQCYPTADNRNKLPSQVNLSDEQREQVKIVYSLEKRLPRNGLSSFLTALAADLLEEQRLLATEDPNRCWTLQTSAESKSAIPFEAGSNCVSAETWTYPFNREGSTWNILGTSLVNALRRTRSYVLDLCSNRELMDTALTIRIFQGVDWPVPTNNACGQFAIDSHRTKLSVLDRTIQFSLIKNNDPSKCLSFIDEVPEDSDRKSIDKLQFEPCEKLGVKRNQKFTIELTDKQLTKLIETLEFQTTFHEKWTEHCKKVKPGDKHERICFFRNHLEWSDKSLEDLVKPLESLFFNAATRQLNPAVVVEAISAGVPVNFVNSGEHQRALSTMSDEDGGIQFELTADYELPTKSFEWASLDMKLSYHFGQDENHRLDLCAKLDGNSTGEIVKFARISASRKRQLVNCTKLALAKTINDYYGTRFQIIQLDNPNKCLTLGRMDYNTFEDPPTQPIGFRFETCSGKSDRSDQAFQLLERHHAELNLLYHLSRQIKNFLAPELGLQYLSLEH